MKGRFILNKRFDGYLLISDMDGTLIDNSGKISERNIEAIKKFQNYGGKFGVATGRTIESAKKYISKLPVDMPVILYNGAKIYDFNKEAVLFEVALEDKIKEIIKKVKEYDSTLGLEIYSDENTYIYNSCRFTERFKKRGYGIYYEVPEEVWQQKWTKVLIVGEEEQIDYIEENFESIFEKINLIRSGENYLEILPEETSKGSTLKILCKELDTDILKVVAAGDNMNDYEMLMNVGYGFGVSNGSKKLLKDCKYICAANDEHSIENVVDWMFKNL